MLSSSNEITWHKYRLFWWPKLVSIIFFSLDHRNLATFLSSLSTRD
jgi:hypothetical protein